MIVWQDRTITKESLVKKIINNSAIILSGNTAASALGFISFAIMAASLGPEPLAYFALAQVYAAIINNIFNVQTWESMIKFGAKDNGDDRLTNTIKTNFFIDLISALVAFVFAILMAKQIGTLLDWDQTLIDLALLYSFTIPFILTTFTIGIPRLFNKFLSVAKLQFATALLKFLMVAAISFYDGDVFAYTSAYIISEIVINLALIIYSIKLLNNGDTRDWYKAKIKLAREEFRFLWWTNLRTIVRIPVRQLDLIIINQVIDTNTVGIYKVYKEVVGIINRLGEPINQAIYPEYAKLLGKDKSEDTVAITQKIMLILSGLSLFILVAMMATAELVIGLIFGEEYLALLSVFYLLVFLNSINLFLTPINSLFVAAGFAKYGFYIVLFNNILYLSVALVGGTYFGIYGIVLAFALQIMFNQGSKIYFLRKHSTGWGTVIR